MKSNKAVIIFIALSFIGGLLAGYGIWGTKETKEQDVGQLLKKALEGVELMQEKNRDLTAELERSKSDKKSVEGLMEETQDIKGQLQAARDELKESENKVAELNAKLAEAKQRVTAEGERKEADSTMSELEKENQALREQLKTAQEQNTTMESHLTRLRAELSETEVQVKAGEELKTLSADLQSRVTALEAENARMKSILEKIDAITKGSEEPAKVAE